MTSTCIENTLVGSSLVEINRHPELNQPILALPLIAQWHKLKKTFDDTEELSNE